ncbi:MAG TPA: FxLYD domain-containing protein [Nitrolancea sp.]|nr:FxLYD domain-containing protein [Nitrolancea sp.]
MSTQRSIPRWLFSLLMLGLLMLPLLLLPGARADSFGAYAFQRLWSRSDLPVVEGSASRAFVWGNQPFTGAVLEQYTEGTAQGVGGVRRVQYFDKGRMEITNDTADAGSTGYLTQGLLAREMITGRVQLGDKLFRDDGPAEINVAGDPDDLNAPTYATLKPLMGYQPIPTGWIITQTVDRGGHLSDDPSLKPYGVTAAVLVPQTNHSVASVFWDYLRSSGTISIGGHDAQGALFDDPLSISGYPLTEPYWTVVQLSGKPTRILVQAFERRVLTYTPDNADGFKVESNNAGRDYYGWRYGAADGSAAPLSAGAVTFHPDADGNLIALGTLSNQARTAWQHVQVTVTLYDRFNQQVARQSSFLDFSVIASGEELPFRVWFDSAPVYDHYRVTASGDVSAAQARGALVPASQEAQPLPGGGLVVNGAARNDASQPVANPLAVVALYDDSGDVVDYAAVALSAATLGPGERAGYSAVLAAPPAAYTHYVVYFSS